MVLMAAVENDHRRGAKATSFQSNSMVGPAARQSSSSSRARLHDFSFPTLSWGTHRVLRCAKNGTASSPAAASPDTTPSPDKEKEKEKEKEKAHRPEGGGGGGGSLPQRRRGAAQRPWNLRTRRSATASPTRRQAGSDEADEAADAADRAPAPTAEAKKRALSIALSKQEIAEDFAAIRGTRPPRRPKKRPRTVQRQLDLLYPGLCLVDVAPGSYKIEER